MKYEIFSRRINWSEERAGFSFLIFDEAIKYWFTIAYINGREYQGEGLTLAKAYARLCNVLDKEGLERISLDKLERRATMSSIVTSRVYNT